MKRSNNIHVITRKIKTYVTQKYEDQIRDIILFGSHARETATDDSDIDLLIVVSDNLNPFTVRQEISSFLFDILMDYQELVLLVVYTDSQYSQHKSPLLLNIKTEGIRI